MVMNDGVLYVFQAHDWSKAFDENGFGHNQRYLCQSVVRAARFELPLSIPASLPTLMQMRSIWPTGSGVSLDAVFAPLLTPPPDIATTHAAAHAPHHAAQRVAQPVLETDSWADRSRPRRAGSFVFPSVYDVDGDSPARAISASGSAAWPTMEAAQPEAVTPRVHLVTCVRVRVGVCMYMYVHVW